MAGRAQRDEVQFRIFAAVAAKFLVVHFQIPHRPTPLTAPAITSQHLKP